MTTVSFRSTLVLLVVILPVASCSVPRSAPGERRMAEPTASAVTPSPVATELLSNPGFADGASGWFLHGAQAVGDLGPDDGPAVLLNAPSVADADDEFGSALTRIPAPAGRPVRFALAAQGLEPGAILGVVLTPCGADDRPMHGSKKEKQELEAGAWRRYVWRYDVPADARRLNVYVGTGDGQQALIARASLMVEDYELEALDEASVTRLAELIEPDVERLRGLLYKKKVPVQVVDDSEARAFFEGRVAKFWPQERQEADELAYRQLGLWPTEQTMVDAILDLMEEQAGGFYEPETETFYVLGDMPRSAAAIIIAHELTHALDDQYYDLDEQTAKLVEDTDRGSAYGAVVEGSGTVIMTKYMGDMIDAGRIELSSLAEMAKSEAVQGEQLAKAPPYLSRSLIFSYVMGMHFLLHGEGQLAMGDFDAEDIDRSFREPPESSEQVLHPESYWKYKDSPRPVELPDLSATLGPTWTLRRGDSLGELLLPILTGGGAIDTTSAEMASPSAWTSFATTGWGGDRWQLYEAPPLDAAGGAAKRHVTLLATLWETPTDAEEFAGELSPPPGSHVERRGQAVVIVAGAEGQPDVESAALANAALDAITPR